MAVLSIQIDNLSDQLLLRRRAQNDFTVDVAVGKYGRPFFVFEGASRCCYSLQMVFCD